MLYVTEEDLALDADSEIVGDLPSLLVTARNLAPDDGVGVRTPRDSELLESQISILLEKKEER